MLKFIELSRWTVKKADVKRIEKSLNGKCLHVTVSGMKDTVLLQYKSGEEADKARIDLLSELGE